MTEESRSRLLWESSADAWSKQVRGLDVNRELLLDAPVLEALGDVSGLRTLDVGCGEGRFVRKLRERGAQAFGLDPTRGLLQRAEGFVCRSIAEALPFADGTFDRVLTYLTLIDIPDFRTGIREMARVLRPGGRLVLANLNSFCSTRPSAWYRTESGEKLHVAVEDYYEERAMEVAWGGMRILNWHRSMESYMEAFLEQGLVLKAFREPRPKWEDVQQHPTMLDEYRVPLFVMMRWDKPE